MKYGAENTVAVDKGARDLCGPADDTLTVNKPKAGALKARGGGDEIEMVEDFLKSLRVGMGVAGDIPGWSVKTDIL